MPKFDKENKRCIHYHKMRFCGDWVPIKKLCDICKRAMGHLAFHHWIYAFRTETVIKNPKLALLNSIIACFPCHRQADALRELHDVGHWERIPELVRSMPIKMRMDVCNGLLTLVPKLRTVFNEALAEAERIEKAEKSLPHPKEMP